MSTAIVWFRRDLRLADNPALAAAVRAHDRVIPLHVHAPDEEAPWSPGAASRWWMHHSLSALDADLRGRGARLCLMAGDSLDSLRALAATVRASAVYWNRLYEPAITARDANIKARLRDDGIDARSFNAALLVEPWEIATATGSPYRMFTPFWRRARARLEPRPPLSAPPGIDDGRCAAGLSLDALDLLPRSGWDARFRESWRPGEGGANRALESFVAARLDTYADARDRPDRDGTSRLSPHLHFGEISPLQIVWALQDAARSVHPGAGAEPFLREIGWREFSHHLLYHFPHTPQNSLNPGFDDFAWAADDEALLGCWRRGETGIPIIDAGMRELWATGWMHNRVRMLAASFLTKNLRQHWRHGARWFWDTLVDADLANNTQGWQWSAGSGADAAPYFRVFNPVTQARKFDADGAYVRRWVPELRDLPAHRIHEPWKLASAPAYPAPIVDLAGSRQRALAAWRAGRG